MSEYELRAAMEEAIRCLTLIGHVARVPAGNTHAARCQAAAHVLFKALRDHPRPNPSPRPPATEEMRGNEA